MSFQLLSATRLSQATEFSNQRKKPPHSQVTQGLAQETRPAYVCLHRQLWYIDRQPMTTKSVKKTNFPLARYCQLLSQTFVNTKESNAPWKVFLETKVPSLIFSGRIDLVARRRLYITAYNGSLVSMPSSTALYTQSSGFFLEKQSPIAPSEGERTAQAVVHVSVTITGVICFRHCRYSQVQQRKSESRPHALLQVLSMSAGFSNTLLLNVPELVGLFLGRLHRNYFISTHNMRP